jgi:hypothetical protein
MKKKLNKNAIVLLIGLLIVSFSIIYAIFSKKEYAEENEAAEITENYNKMKVSYLEIKERKTGTSDWDNVSDMDGHDASPDDNYLRTMDTMSYVLELGIERNEETTSPNEVLYGGRIKVRVTIPKENNKPYLSIVPDSWMKDIRHNDDYTSYITYYDIPSNKVAVGGNQQLSITITANNAKHELSSEYMPIFEVWMEGNKNDNINSSVESKTIQDEGPLYITASPYAYLSLNKGNLNQSSGHSQRLNFTALLGGSSSKGREIPYTNMDSYFTIEYYYTDIDNSNGWIRIDSEQENSPMNYINLHSTIACGTGSNYSNSTWSENYYYYCGNNNYAYISSNSLEWYMRNSGVVTATKTGDRVDFSNTGFSYWGNSNVVAVSDEFTLSVPWYEPEQGKRYQYMVTIKAYDVNVSDSQNNEYTIDNYDSITFTFYNYMTGNFDEDFYLTSDEYRVYSDTAVVPLDSNVYFESRLDATDGPYEGGVERLIVWNGKIMDIDYNYYCPDVDYSDYHSRTFYIYLGIYKADPENGIQTDEQANAATMDDFDWYSPGLIDYDLIKEKGKIAAVKSIEREFPGNNITSYLWDIRFRTTNDKNMVGEKGIIRQKIYVYGDEEKTIKYELGTESDYVPSIINDDRTDLEREAAPRKFGETVYIGSNMGIRVYTYPNKYSYNVEEEYAQMEIMTQFYDQDDDKETSNFKIWVEIPNYLTYKENSANIAPTSVVTYDSYSEITWEFNNWNLLDRLPDITYLLDISPYAPNNVYQTVSTYASSPDVLSGYSYSSASFYLINLSGSSLRKVMAKDSLDKDESINVDNYLYNISQQVLYNVKTVEILPKNGDATDTSYNGSYTFKVLSLANNQQIYYTTNSIDNIGLVTDNIGNQHIQSVDLSTDSRWHEVHVGDVIPSDATAIATYVPQVSVSADIMYRLKFIPSGNTYGDKYHFKFTASSDNLTNAVTTEYKRVVITDREISGKVFFDIDRNNILSNADTLLTNKTVKIYNSRNQLVSEATTNDDGEYSVRGLPKDLYYISYDLSEYQEFVDNSSTSISYRSIINPETGQSELFSDLNRGANYQEELIKAEYKNVGIKYHDSRITVHHYVTGTNTKVHEDTYIDTYYSAPYEVKPLITSELDGEYKDRYSYDEISEGHPIIGEVNKYDYDVILYYDIRPAAVITHHYLKDTTTRISDNVISMKRYGDSYTTSRIEDNNYLPAGVGETPTSGIVSQEVIDIIYYYELKPSTITVHHYVDGTTTRVHDDDIINTNYTSDYETNHYEQDDLYDEYKNDYLYINNSIGVTKGKASSDNIEVIYYYAKDDAKLVVHHYAVGTNIKVHENEYFDKKINDRYETHYKESSELFDHDFVYDSVNGEPTGSMSDKRVVVTYYYKLKTGTVTVHHITDDKNTKICPDETINGNYKDKYNFDSCTELSDINYTFDKIVTNASNTFVTGDKISGRINQDNIEITYYYTYKPGQIVTHYFLSDTRERVADDVIASGKLNEEYSSEEKLFEGYKLVKEPDNNTLTFKENTQEIVYEYERIKYKVEVSVIGGKGTITGAEEVFHGDNQKNDIVITPNENYELNSVIINGKEYPVINIEGMILNGFENVRENILVEAKFVEKTQEVPITGATRNTLLYIGSILFIIAVSIFMVYNRKKETK